MKLYKLYVVFAYLVCFCTAAAMEENMDIFQAAPKGDTKRVLKLLKDDPDLVNVQDELKCTLLHLACFWGHPQTAKLLLQHQANVNTQDYSKGTPLHNVSYWDHPEMVKLLLSYGAIPYSPINLFEKFSRFSKLYAQGHQAFINKVKKERDKVFWILRSIKCKEGGERIMLPAELCDKIVELAFSGIKEWQQFKEAHPEIAKLANTQEGKVS